MLIYELWLAKISEIAESIYIYTGKAAVGGTSLPKCIPSRKRVFLNKTH